MNAAMSIEELRFSSKEKGKDLFTDLRLLDWESDVSVLLTPITDLPLRSSKSNKWIAAVFSVYRNLLRTQFLVLQLLCSMYVFLLSFLMSYILSSSFLPAGKMFLVNV